MDNTINDILTRGTANVIPNKSELQKKLSSGQILNIYLGIDATATRIHLGHAVPLRKLQKLADLGHNVTFLIGDFTALIGDTSDKDSERPILTVEEIEENFKTYKKQAEKLLDFSKVKVVHNSDWLSKLGFKDVVELTQKFTLNDFISRELIKKRLTDGKSVRLQEVLYPVMQGYDSYHLDTDLQLGGADQTFNMQAGRTLQKLLRDKESYVLATDYLPGTDGRKMSKSWGNAVWLEDSPRDMYGKIMSITDDVIITYFTLATNLNLEEVKKYEDRLKNHENPIHIKKELAKLIVSELHSQKDAEEAEANFEKTVQNKELPEDIPTVELNPDAHLQASDLLVTLGLAGSKSEAKRLVEQGAVLVNDELVGTPNQEIIPEDNMIIKSGKRNYVRIKLN
ncbi:MAG TPA: tyrosine--tRNA ligase [Patescibacteria group bacterium]|nr:tyrosine--tRNA ligase [Patescibacteria group bacterium]